MTAGAKTKLQVDGVISIRSCSATNDLVVLNEFEHRLWDCLARRRQTAMVCGQKINSPTGVTKQSNEVTRNRVTEKIIERVKNFKIV